MGVILHHGEALAVLKELAEASADAIITDPPYHLPSHASLDVNMCLRAWLKGQPYPSRESHAWVPGPEIWKACIRVLKPGGHLLCFSGHAMDLMTMSVRMAGFELRDSIAFTHDDGEVTMKPGWLPIIVARKPMIGTVVQNLREWGVGGINIDGSRIGDEEMIVTKSIGVVKSQNRAMGGPNYEREVAGTVTGRFPTNVIHDGSRVVEQVFELFGYTTSNSGGRSTGRNFGQEHDDAKSKDRPRVGHDDEGTVSRFFYSAKHTPSEVRTEKPETLLRYLVGLVVPPGGTVIDPFARNGTTGAAALALGMNAVLIERDAQSAKFIQRRLSA